MRAPHDGRHACLAEVEVRPSRRSARSVLDTLNDVTELPLLAGASCVDGPPTRVCLVGVDGLRVDDALGGGCPALAGLVAGGALAAMTMEVPTVSGPGWTSILTGSRHAEHGVTDNGFRGHTIAPLSDLLSQAAQAVPRAVTFAAASWPPLVDPVGPGPVVAWRTEHQRAGLHRVVVRDGETYGYRTTDAEVGACAQLAVSAGGVDAAFVYLGQVDEAGHLHGGSSPEYRAAMRRVDGLLGSLVGAISGRAERSGEDWVVAVTTDHGHLDEGGHGGAEDVVRRSFLAARRFGPRATEVLRLPPSVEPWDVTPWLLQQLTSS